VAETAGVAAAEVSWTQTRSLLRVIMIVLLVGALIWVLYRIEGVILLLVLSIFFAYLVAPLVEFVRRPFKMGGRERIVPRGLAIGIVYLVIFGALTVALWILLPKLSKQIKAFSEASTQFQTTAEGRVKLLNDFCRRNEISENVCNALNDAATSGIGAAKNYIATDLPNLVVSILSYIPWLILIPILSFFFLKDVDTFRRSALQMLPRGRWRWRGDEFFQDVNSTLAAYIRAQLTACLLIGLICTIGFYFIGLPYWLPLGIIAGLLEFIPLVGPLTIALAAASIGGFYSFNMALGVIIFLGVLRIFQDYVIYPRIIGQGIHLHPLAVILSILAGAELAGIAGIFLAIPVVAVATVSYRHWLEHRGSEGLVADLLKPEESEAATAVLTEAVEANRGEQRGAHPTVVTTSEEMARIRPDLTTGELKVPKMD
jgi:predicted PurR-regulated permease PerM